MFLFSLRTVRCILVFRRQDGMVMLIFCGRDARALD